MSASTFAVFVPTAIGAGLIASLLLAIGDLLAQLRSEKQRQRSVAILAASTASLAAGASIEEASRIGVRSRRVARFVALVLGGLGVYGAIGSFWNYWNPVDMFNQIAWIWALSWLASFAFIGAGVAAWFVSREGTALRGPARALVVGSHLGTASVEGASVAVTSGEVRGQQVLGEQQHRSPDEHAGHDV